MRTQPEHGISMIELLISILILSVGVIAYAKSWSNAASLSIENAERQQIASMAGDLSNVFAAHLNNMNTQSSRNSVISRLNTFASQLEQSFESNYASAGYECVQGRPRLTGPRNFSQLNSTLMRAWALGPSVCIQFKVLDQINTGFNGVWVETKVTWISIQNRAGELETLTMPSLIAPM